MCTQFSYSIMNCIAADHFLGGHHLEYLQRGPTGIRHARTFLFLHLAKVSCCTVWPAQVEARRNFCACVQEVRRGASHHRQ